MTESSEILRLLWLQCLQLTALVAVVWMITRLLRHRSPQIICALWLVVLLKCVTPPVWSSSAGVFCWVQDWYLVQTRDETVVERPVEGADVLMVPAATPDAASGVMFLTETDVRADSGGGRVQAAGADAPSSVCWPIWLLRVWLGGIVVAAMWLLIRVVRCFALFRSSVTSPELQALVNELVEQLQLRCFVRLRITTSNVGPAVTGLFRPLIVLPQVIVSSSSPDSLRPVIMHELIHIRRGDLWLGFLQAMSRLIWWFHPLVYVAARQASRSAESCCDQESLAALGCSPRAYADCLLLILEQKKNLVPVPTFPGVRAVDLTSTRLEQIMKARQGSLRNGKRWSRVVLALSLAVVLPGAALMHDQAGGSRGAVTIADGSSPEATLKISGQKDEQSPSVSRVTMAYKVDDILEAWGKASGLEPVCVRDLFQNHLKSRALRQSAESVPHLDWLEDVLVCSGPPVAHEPVQTELARLRRDGIHQITIRVQMWEMSDDEVDALQESIAAGDLRLVDREWPIVSAQGGEGHQTVVSEEELRGFRSRLNKVDFHGQMSNEDAAALAMQLQSTPDVNCRMNMTYHQVESQAALMSQNWDERLRRTTESEETVKHQVHLRLTASPADGQLVIDGQYEYSCDHRTVSLHVDVEEEKRKLREAIDRDYYGLQATEKPPEDVTRVSWASRLPVNQSLVLVGVGSRRDEQNGRKTVLLLTPHIGTKFLPRDATAESVPAEERYVVKAYQVADLVVPVPENACLHIPFSTEGPDEDWLELDPEAFRAVRTKPQNPGESVSRSALNFRLLMDLIVTTVAPGSWFIDGGEGNIGVNEKNIVLVIRQTESVHQKVAELLEQLRTLRHLQVTLQCEIVWCDSREAAAMMFEFDTSPNGHREGWLLPTDSVLNKWRQLVARQPKNRRSHPKVSVFSRQQLCLKPGLSRADGMQESVFQLEPFVSPDHRQVTFRFATKRSGLKAHVTVTDGVPLLIDATDCFRAGQVPGLNDEDRVLIGITPTIVTPEEEEEITLEKDGG